MTVGSISRLFGICGSVLFGALLCTFVPEADAQQGPPPWSRTETRADCSNFDLTRQPFWGDTHVHSEYSADAWAAGASGTPYQSYEFAKGAELPLPNGRTAQLARPLDFTMVSEHAEMLGEVALCKEPGSVGYDEIECVDMRDVLAGGANPPPVPVLPDNRVLNFLIAYATYPPTPFSWCGTDRVDCLAAMQPIWQDIQDAAEAHYDRSDVCEFTTFIGYEWTAGGQNLPDSGGTTTFHRNVLFRNENVPPAPTSFVEENAVQGLYAALDTDCNDGNNCDVLLIGHGANVAGPFMYDPVNDDGSPMTSETARKRSEMEPLIESTQHKGNSECMIGVGTSDEDCNFDLYNGPAIFSFVPTQNPAVYNPLAFIRNAQKEGLQQEELLQVNPFDQGWIGSTDTHNNTPGLVRESDWGEKGHLGNRDSTAPYILTQYPASGIRANPGGMAGCWAEENSRDALYSAMQRKECWSTSGPRINVRFFAGDFKGDPCADGAVVSQGYERGVPMGSEIGSLRGSKSPMFALLATKDPGGGGDPSTPLQHAQVIKVWIDENGVSQEQVYAVVGDRDNGASVDDSTCATSGPGSDSLCTVWEDPDFDPSQRAVYYARVFENPVCRWSTVLCNSLGVDCSDPDNVDTNYTQCCNEMFPRTINERAWSSPVFYRPESFGKFKAKISVKGGNNDTLKLSAAMAAAGPDLDPNTNPVVLNVTDDDVIYTATLPAGSMEEKKPGAVWKYVDKTGAIDGVKKALVKIGGKGNVKFALQTVAMDLSNADLTQHFVNTQLDVGYYRARHGRLWNAKGTTLAPQN